MFLSFLLVSVRSATIDASATDYNWAQYSEDIDIINIPSDKSVFISFSNYVTGEDIGLTLDDLPISMSSTAEYRAFELKCSNCTIEVKTNPVYLQTWIIDSTMCNGVSYIVQGSDFYLTAHSFTNPPDKTLCLFVQSSFRAMTIQQNVRGYNERSTTIMRPDEIAQNEEPIFCDSLDCVNGTQGPFFVYLNGSIINYELVFRYYTQIDPVYDGREALPYYKVTPQGLSTDSEAFMRVAIQAAIASEIGATSMSEGVIIVIILGSLVIIGIFVAISLCIVKCCTGCCYFCPCYKWSANARKEALQYESEPERREVVRTVGQSSPIQFNIHPMRNKPGMTTQQITMPQPSEAPKNNEQHEDDLKEDQQLYQV